MATCGLWVRAAGANNRMTARQGATAACVTALGHSLGQEGLLLLREHNGGLLRLCVRVARSRVSACVNGVCVCVCVCVCLCVCQHDRVCHSARACVCVCASVHQLDGWPLHLE